MLRASRLSFPACLIVLACFVGLLVYKSQAAPLPPYSYLRGTFLPTLTLLMVGLAPFSFVRPVLVMGICGAVAAICALLAINQLLALLIPSLLLASRQLYMMETATLFVLLLGSHFLWRYLFRPSKSAALIATFLQAALAATILAFLLKLESYPDALPYRSPASLVTVWAPLAFAGVAFVINLFQILRRVDRG